MSRDIRKLLSKLKNKIFPQGKDTAIKQAIYEKNLFDKKYVSPKNYDKNYDIIVDSQLFDKEYYHQRHQDVKKAGMDALEHWIKYGYRENTRNPNSNFNQKYYRTHYLKEETSTDHDWNPLTHYILNQDEISKTNVFGFLNLKISDEKIDLISKQLDTKVSILILVHDTDSLNFCLENIKKYTVVDYEIKLLNYKNLELDFEKDQNISQIDNSNNESLTDFINKNMKKVSSDVVILNSFTEVTPNWIKKMIVTAYSQDNIDMITPLSNSIIPNNFSVKNGLSITNEGLSFLINKSNIAINNKMFFADGFCVFIKKDTIPLFELEKNKIYYDNENKILSYEIPDTINNILDDSTYVYHNKEFFDLNSKLLKNFNINKSFNEKVKNYIESEEIGCIVDNIRESIKQYSNNTLSNRILFVVDSNNLSLIRDFLLKEDNNIFDIFCLSYDLENVILWKDFQKIHQWSLDSEDVDCDMKLKNIYFNTLYSLNINLIHVWDFKNHNSDLFDVSEILKIPLLFTIKDKYPLSLMEKAEDSTEDEKFTEILKKANKILVFDKIKQEYEKHLKDFDNTISVNYPLNLDELSHSNIETRIEKPNVLLLGNYVDDTKTDVLEEIDKDNLELYLVGNLPPNLKNKVHNMGELSLENIINTIESTKFDYIVIFEEFEEIFELIEKNYEFKIPILMLNDKILSEIKEEEIGVHLFEKDDLISILSDDNVDNYYNLINDLYKNDVSREEFLKFILSLMDIYSEFTDSSAKFKINRKNSNANVTKYKFKDFSGFLSDSYLSPEISVPFNEEEKCCFAFMDNISMYLRSFTQNLDEKPLVSIIMPTFNRKKLLQEAIDSVLNQTYQNFELIIVDDSSTDNTLDFLRNLRHEKINVIFNKTNMGPAGSRNVGLQHAKGEYIAYLDSDNEWDKYYLEASVGSFEKLKDADAIYSGQLIYPDKSSPIQKIRFGAYNKSLLKNRNYIDLNCFCHKRSILDDIGMFDESLERLEDWDLILRISNNYKIFSVPFLHSKYYDFNDSDRISNFYLLNNEKNSFNEHYVELIQNKNKTASKQYPQLTRKVSIIIPSYQSLKDLKECVNSIRKNYDEKVDIIIVDNNSNEAVRYYLKVMENKKQIKLIQNDVNYGFTHAVNMGIDISDENSDILLLNNDAILTSYSLEALQDVAYSADDIGITVPQQILPGGTKTLKIHVPYATSIFECDVNPSIHHQNIINMDLYHDGGLLEMSFAPFFCTYIKREMLDKTFGLDAQSGRHYRSDRVFSEYVRKIMKQKIIYVSDAVVYHKLQKATEKLQEDEEYYDLMFRKNQWEAQLCEQLGFRNPIWDDL